MIIESIDYVNILNVIILSEIITHTATVNVNNCIDCNMASKVLQKFLKHYILNKSKKNNNGQQL